MAFKYVGLAAAAVSIGVVHAATAADMPVKTPAAIVAHSWSGCYVGGVAGYQAGRSRQDYGGLVNGVPNAFLPTGFSMTDNYGVDGPQFGGTVGCNYQAGNWVVGLEADGSFVGARGRALPTSAAIALGLNSNFEFTTKQTWMATGRARLGYANGRLLTYVTGGVVAGGFELNNQNSLLPAGAIRTPTDVTQVGWIVGFGAEYALADKWSVKAEALYADYGVMHYGDEPGTANGCTAGCANADVPMTAIIGRLGVNYKF
jgi:outer membrane immunogenic protein